jgi:hypothetical protein
VLAVDLKVKITITDEQTDEVISSTGWLDLASGEISRVEYQDYDVAARGLPWDSKDVEFRVDVNKTTGQYSVSASELLEIKLRAAALFAGISGKDLLGNLDAKAGTGKAGRLH